MPNHIQRPPCPKCGMNMIAINDLKNSKQTFHCLRCGHEETRRIGDDPSFKAAANLSK